MNKNDNYSTAAVRDRRVLLRTLVKAMVLIGLVALGLVLLQTLLGSGQRGELHLRGAAVSYPVADLPAGQMRVVSWHSKPVLILHKLSQWQLPASLASILHDPLSEAPLQPAKLGNPQRSLEPEWFVALAVGSDLGCTLNFLPPSEQLFKRQRWPGGFVDACRKSRYDLAGRVFSGQLADANLMVPRWYYDKASGQIVVGAAAPSP